jgi:Na+/H+ antiporter
VTGNWKQFPLKTEYMFDVIKTQQPILNKEVIAVSFFETEKEWVNEELNNERQTVIPAIASFSTGGVVLPVYVRLGDLKLKIEKVKWHKPVSVFGERYYCLVSSSGVEFEIVLTYHTKEQIWTIDNKQIDIRKLTFT